MASREEEKRRLREERIAAEQAAGREAERRRRMQIIGAAALGVVVIAVIVISALLIGRSFQRQLRLARLKTDLVAAVSHELKTPLTVLTGFLETLADMRLEERQRHRYHDRRE